LGKQNQYDHSVRTPFIIKGPNVPKNKSAIGMFYINSVFPTAAEMAGLDIPKSVQAPSIAQLIKGNKTKVYDSIYGSYRHFQRMIRTEEYKLIYYPEINKIQLFNIKSDPDELHDLSGLQNNEAIIKIMFDELHNWQAIVNDLLLLKN
jgi:arylsulfatase A-like enzyme